MNIIFFTAAAVAVISTILVITGRNAIHSLLYLIVSLLSSALIFYLIGAPFIAALEVIIYAGAIMVLFIFVVMMLNMGDEAKSESMLFYPGIWIGPALLAGVLFLLMAFTVLNNSSEQSSMVQVQPKDVGVSLFSFYLLGVELAGFLLLAGIVGAYHLGSKIKKPHHRFLQDERVE